MDDTRPVRIVKIDGEKKENMEASVVTEYLLSITINGSELAVLSCSPSEQEYMAAGFAQSQGIISTKDDIKEINVSGDSVDIVTSGPVDIPTGLVLTTSSGRSSRLLDVEKMKCESPLTVTAGTIFSVMEEFEHHSKAFKKTGGVHSAALYDTDNMVVFSEDVGRHNAIDKVFGRCLLEDIDVGQLCIVTSGRVSSDIMLKIARRRVPVLIARNSPTDLGVEMAEKAGITLCGFVRGESMNVYTHPWRVE